MTENIPEPPAPGQVPFQTPSSRELFEFFEQFFIRWANLSVEYISGSVETVLPMGLEEGILFSEPTSGLLVIRASENFRHYLLDEYERKQKGAQPVKSEIFLEMTVLFWHIFARRYFQMDSRKMAPAVLRSSLPVDWPDREPQTITQMMVKGNPLELRLWTGLNPGEITRFRRSKA
jgi:hypothetical protein